MLLGLVLSNITFGQQQGTILFKISSPDLSHDSYILGSHHAFGKSFFDTLTTANEMLMLADVVIKESLDIVGHTTEEIINERNKTTNWNSYLNKKDRAFIDSLFQNSTTDVEKLTPTELNVVLNRLYTMQVCQTR